VNLGNNDAAGTVSINGFAALGAIAGMFTIEQLGRRKMLLIPFWVMVVTLLVVGVWSGAPAAIVVLCFAGFAFFNASAAVLTPVYPTELFPTSIRTSGTGLATAASRVGAAVGTFLLPVGLATIGVGPSMIIGAAVSLVGVITTYLYAPETKGKTLSKATNPRLQPVAATPGPA
jgi:putative MFS transporter